MQLLFCGIFSGYRAPFLRLPGKIATSEETVAKKKSVVTFRERSCHYFRAVPMSYPKGPLIKCGFHVLHFEIARPEEAPLTLAFSRSKMEDYGFEIPFDPLTRSVVRWKSALGAGKFN